MRGKRLFSACFPSTLNGVTGEIQSRGDQQYGMGSSGQVHLLKADRNGSLWQRVVSSWHAGRRS